MTEVLRERVREYIPTDYMFWLPDETRDINDLIVDFQGANSLYNCDGLGTLSAAVIAGGVKLGVETGSIVIAFCERVVDVYEDVSTGANDEFMIEFIPLGDVQLFLIDKSILEATVEQKAPLMIQMYAVWRMTPAA